MVFTGFCGSTVAEISCLAAWRPAFFGAWLHAVRFFCWANAKGDEKKKKRVFSLVLALLLCVGLAAPVLAAEEVPEVEIVWFDQWAGQEIDYTIMDWFMFWLKYNARLNWVTVRHYDRNSQAYDGFVVDLSTGDKVEEYDLVGKFSEGLAMVGKVDAEGNLKLGYINTKGEVVIPLEYDNIADFSDGLAMVAQIGADGNYKYGFVNTKGKVVIPLEYDDAEVFCDGLAAVRSNGKWGFINAKGEVVIPIELEYDSVWPCVDGIDLAAVTKFDAERSMSGRGLINKKGEVVAPIVYHYPDYRDGFFPSDGMVAAEIDGKWGYLNAKGEVAIPFEYDGATAFSDGLAAVKDENGAWSFIDKKGQMVSSLEYENVGEFSNGLVAVESDEGWGFVNTKGEVVVPLKYAYVDFCYTNASSFRTFLPICWVLDGSRVGIFKNPYWLPEKEDATSGTVGGGFPVVPVVIGVAVVAAAVIVLLLVVKKKKAAPAPVAVTQAVPAPVTTSDVPTAPNPVSPSSVAPAPAPTPAAEPPRFCSNCGKPLAPGVNFCSSCGYNVKDGEG